MGRRSAKAPKTPVARAFLAHERAIKLFFRRFLSNAHDPDDLTQEVFVRAYQSEKDKEIQEPTAFLYGVARKVALKEISRKSRAIVDYVEDFTPSTDLYDRQTVEDIADDRQKLRLLAEAVSQLPPQCRKVFILRKVYGFSNKEIARRLMISTSTVEKHVAAGLRRTGEYLSQTAGCFETAGDARPVAVLQRRRQK